MKIAVRCLQSLARHPELLVVAFMVAIVGALVVPLPPALLDLLLVANLGLSLTLLVSALHLRGPLALSTFPTLLLVATLFRLSLNVSSTRLILGEGAAGKVIAAFGEFVVGGSYVVGAVVFVIVLLVQLLVVAKGAERVAEVGARFTLDALPGKQMAIDADLRAGASTQDEASRRRRDLERESQFYGALDGAMKFVKGDAIAGLLVTGINVVGGLAVGITVHGLPAGEAAATYTLLTIGDGLVSQLPALLTAVAAGLVVTRVGTGARLGADVVEQLAAQPRAIIASGVVLALLGLVPGLPALPFVALGACAAGLGALRLSRDGGDDETEDSPAPRETRRAGGAESKAAEASEPPGGAPVVLLLDGGVADEIASALLEGALPGLRRRIASDLGLPLPNIPLVRVPRPGNTFEILVNDLPVFKGAVPEGPTVETPSADAALLALDHEAGPRVGASSVTAPAEEESGELLPASKLPALVAGLGVTSPETIVAGRLEEIIRQRAGELLTLEMVQDLLDLLEQRAPALVREASRRLPLPLLFEILARLLDEQVSIRPLDRIVQALIRRGEAREGPASAGALSEQARQALGRHLVHRPAGSTGLAVVLLDPLLEDLLRESRTDTADGPVLALMPEHQASLVAAMKRELHGGAVLLAPADLRRQLWALARATVSGATVLAYQELPLDTRVQPVSRLAIEGLDPLMLARAA